MERHNEGLTIWSEEIVSTIRNNGESDLVGSTSKWNKGKRAELKNRVKHTD